MSSGNFGLGVLIGAAIGVAIGILYAPRAGCETREMVAERVGEAWQKIRSYGNGKVEEFKKAAVQP